MRRLTHPILTFGLLAFVFTACTKEGPTGPQGAQGPQGNANVQSQTFTVSSWDYVAPSYRANVTWSAITQSIVDNGSVLVYLSNNSGGFEPLPVTVYPSTQYESNYTAVHFLNGVTFWKTDSDLTQPANPGTRVFKVVAIASSAMTGNSDLDWTDYNQVRERFELE